MSAEVPVGHRAVRPGWRDPRILAGIAVMAAAILFGGWVFSSRDATAAVLVLRRDLPAGAEVGPADLTITHLPLAAGERDRYLAAGALPAHAVLDRPVGAGELVPRSAIVAAGRSARVEVPLAVAPADLPSTVGPGASVDVWVLPDAEHGGVRRAERVLTAVRVLRVSDDGGALAPQSDRQVIVTVPDSAADVAAGTEPGSTSSALADALTRLAGGRIVLTRKDG